jgi:hypothetical protein
MFQYRITKYDKSKRDENGYYIGEDQWTECSDIGRIINGKEVLLGDYLDTETKYIDAALNLFDASDLPHLRLTSIGTTDHFSGVPLPHNKNLKEPEFDNIAFMEDHIVQPNEIPTVIKMILRDFGWAKLEFKDAFFIHFGCDFYMYIGTVKTPKSILEEIEKNGLFVEERPSPFMPNPGRPLEIRIERSPKDGEFMDQDFLIKLPPSLHTELREAWGFSEEHPFWGTWQIKPKHEKALSQFTDHHFDFGNFRYSLQTDWET